MTSNRIRAIEQDDQGNLWFGTEGGLTSYNPGINGERGYFTQFTVKEGLSNNHVRSLFKDSRGQLWIGTHSGGVNLYNPEKGGAFTHYTRNEGLSFNWISSILEDEQKNMWFGTMGGGGGVNRFDPILGEYGTFTYYRTSEGLNNNRVQSMLKDSRGHLWFGLFYPGGVHRYSGALFAHYSSENGLSYDFVVSILEDRRGNLWIGGFDGGVNRYTPNTYGGRGSFTHYTKDQGLHDNRVVSLMEGDQGNLWFGAPAGGVNKFNPVSGKLTHYGIEEGLIRNNGGPALKDRQGRLWFRVRMGLSRYDPAGKGTFTNYTLKGGLGHMLGPGIMEDGQGNLWFGTLNGLCRYEPNAFNGRGGFMHFTANEGLNNNHVISMMKDSWGNLWFGTFGGGLNLFVPPNSDQDGPGHFIHYSTKEGLISNTIVSIVEDHQKNIWLSTNKGISLLIPPPRSGKTGSSGPVQFQFFNYGSEDGFKWTNFSLRSSCLDRSNRIWWGSSGGLTMLDLNQFEPPSAIPQPKLNDIAIGGNYIDFRRLSGAGYRDSLSMGKKLAGTFDSVEVFHNYPSRMILPHRFKHLTFHFSAIEWDAPHKVRYSYRLKGLEKQWSLPSPAKEADYRNLTSGKYTFQVKAIGAAQTWSKPFEYSFSILPPWWLTWQAFLFYGLIILLFLYQTYRFPLNRQLEHAEILRLQELDTFKTRLYTNITHEFRTPLTIILGMARQIKEDPKRWYSEGLNMITRNGRQLLGLVN